MRVWVKLREENVMQDRNLVFGWKGKPKNQMLGDIGRNWSGRNTQGQMGSSISQCKSSSVFYTLSHFLSNGLHLLSPSSISHLLSPLTYLVSIYLSVASPPIIFSIFPPLFLISSLFIFCSVWSFVTLFPVYLLFFLILILIPSSFSTILSLSFIPFLHTLSLSVFFIYRLISLSSSLFLCQ